MGTRAAKIILWICISLLSIQFLGAGITKLSGSWSARFTDWGYSMFFMYAVGVCEVIGVAGLFLSKTRKWSCMLLMIIMGGAAWTHLMNQEYVRLIHNGVVAGIAFLVLRIPPPHRRRQGVVS